MTARLAAGSGARRRARRSAAATAAAAAATELAASAADLAAGLALASNAAPDIAGTWPPGLSTPVPNGPKPAFAHASEAEMARILDFYQVRWEYEPHTFPILWNLDGTVVESFSPDFWLPDLDLYLEMTTLRQKLVRKKNRKLRRVLALYPDLRVKLFYARDFRALMLKFGKVGLVRELSGTSGQVVPDRSIPSDRATDGETAS